MSSEPEIDSDESIDVHRARLVRRPPGHPKRFKTLHRLAKAMLLRFQQRGRLEDLEESVDLYRAALALSPPGHRHRSTSLNDLARGVLTRFQKMGRMEDLDECVYLYRAAVALRRPDHPKLSRSLNDLASALLTRLLQTGMMVDLDECVDLYREALALHPPGDSGRSSSLSALARGVHNRFQRTGRMEDIDEAVSLHRAVIELVPLTHPARSSSLTELSGALLARFKETHRMADLKECVDLNRKALSLRPSGHSDRALSLSNLATAVLTRFEQVGQVEDLEEAVDLFRAALDLLRPSDADRGQSLQNLANALRASFMQTGGMRDLKECIDLNRAALALCPSPQPNRYRPLNNLANAVITQFEQMGRAEDLKEAIDLYREALSLHPLGDPYRPVSLNNLATAVRIRFQQTGQMEDLEECVDLNRTALLLRPPGHPERSRSLNILAITVRARFEEMGRMEDLEECVDLNRMALSLCPPGHPDRATSLNNLANAVRTRFEQKGRVKDLTEAVDLNRAALSLRPEGHPYRYQSLNSLANAVRIRFEQTGWVDDHREAVDLYRAGLALRPPGHPDRSVALNNFANAKRARFEQTGQMEDLEEAIELHRAVLALRPPGHPDRSESLSQLADALHRRSHKTDGVKDLTEIFDMFRSSTEHQFSSVLKRLQISLRWQTLARKHRHSTALDAYKASLSLLGRALALSPTIEMQHQRLKAQNEFSTLALDAASYAIDVGNYVEAVEMLEQGRAMLWSELYRLRTPLDELQEVNKGLADEFLETSRMLESLSTSSEEAAERASESHAMSLTLGSQLQENAGSEDRIGHMLNRKRRLEENRLALIDKIRDLPGGHFKNFLRATPFEMLKVVAEGGPVVVVVVANLRCDALIILETHDSPALVPLGGPEVYKALSTLSKRLLHTRKSLRTQEKEYNNELRETLKALWKLVVGAVTRKLLELGVKPGSRIWWCPTSVLGTLPLHAAGIISPALSQAPKAKYLSDLFISSYTPTLTALIRARSSSQPHAEKPPSMVVVWNDRNLHTVREEVQTLLELPQASVHEIHCKDRATSESVAGELKEHSWVHIACHGQLVRKQPFESSFLLFGDTRLSLLNIVRSQLPNTEFAFLSACHSAELTSDGGYDEVLHLTAAMQFCGFRSVVGTMWEMADVDGPQLTKEFYKVLLAEGGVETGFRRSAQAINAAAKSLRKSKELGVTLERWVNYVHFGA